MGNENGTADESGGDVRVTLALLERLRARDLLSDSAFERASELHRSRAFPWKWLDRILLGTAVSMLLAGSIFLVAFNWHEIPEFGKLGLVQGVLVACLGVAGWRGLDSRVGNAAVIAGSVFVGISLAVYGQIYQTGADPWELFAGWAGLIVGFAALARSQTLWMIWALLVNVAAVLYWEQVLVYAPDRPTDLGLTTVLGMFNGAVLVAREWVWSRWRSRWLQHPWSRWLLAGTSLAYLTAGTWLLAFYKLDKAVSEVFQSSVPDVFQSGVLLAALGNLVVWGVGSLAIYRYFRQREFEFVVLIFWGVSCGMFGMIWSHILVFDVLDLGDAFALMTYGSVGLVLSSGLAYWFRRLWSDRERTEPSSSEGGNDE
jgi:uncharacterized membrane protein